MSPRHTGYYGAQSTVINKMQKLCKKAEPPAPFQLQQLLHKLRVLHGHWHDVAREQRTPRQWDCQHLPMARSVKHRSCSNMNSNVEGCIAIGAHGLDMVGMQQLKLPLCVAALDLMAPARRLLHRPCLPVLPSLQTAQKCCKIHRSGSNKRQNILGHHKPVKQLLNHVHSHGRANPFPECNRKQLASVKCSRRRGAQPNMQCGSTNSHDAAQVIM